MVRSGESPLAWLVAEEHNVNAPALSIYLFIYLFIHFKQLMNGYSGMRQEQTSRWFPNEARSTAVKSLLTCIFFVITVLTEVTSEVFLFYFLSSTVFASTGDLPPPAPLLELATASYQSLKLRWTSRNTGSKTGVAGVTYTLQMLDKNGRSDCNKVLAPFLGMKPSHIFYIDWIKNECSCLVGVVCL